MPTLRGDPTGATAVVFAGGLGTRLRSAVADRPKVLAEVRGRPFLSYLLDQLVDAGFSRAVLCTGYMAEQVEAAFGDAHGVMRIDYSREAGPLGTGGALRLALDRLDSDPVLVMNGDSFCHADLIGLWARHLDVGAEATMLLVEVPDTARYGRVTLDANGALTAFTEKGSVTGPGWINAGAYVLRRAVVESISPGGVVSLEKEVLPLLVGRGLYGFDTDGPFLDIGTPESYAAAEQFFAGVRPRE